MPSIIYESRGRAREYSELAANLYRGCSHGCTYCYAPLALRMKRESFIQPSIREGALSKLEKDAKLLNKLGEKRTVLLSFTTDPYQPIDCRYQLTRQAIQILHEYNLKVSILTKGGMRAERDFDLLSKNLELSEYGTTLVFTDEDMRKIVEPGAASTTERIKSLKIAHEMGIYTYVSLEPVWYPEQTLQLIEMTYQFVDLFKVGKLNYNPQQAKIDWKQFKLDVIRKLKQYQKKYYIKVDLEKY